MARTTKIIGFSVPPSMVLEVERVSRAERRTKSELFREMFRVYKNYRKQRDQDDDRWVTQIIADAHREKAQKPISREEMLKEDAKLLKYGQSRVKKLGIEEEDIDQIIHASRARRKA